MKLESDKLVESVDGTDYVDIGAKFPKDAFIDASGWSMLTARN